MKKFLFILFCSLISLSVYAEKHEEEAFNPGNEIINHILDSHDWHICDWGEHHISIPLPVILIYDGKVSAFMSSKFEHGHATYKGFGLNEAGKVVHYEGDGSLSAKKPLDFSITKNVAAIFISIFVVFFIFLAVARSSKKLGHEKTPKGLQNLIEPMLTFIKKEVAAKFIDAHNIDRFMPYLVTVFFFILVNNLMGLIPIFPGGANVTGNIAVTLVLALLTFFIVNINGTKNYWKHIFNTPGVPMFLKVIPLMPIVEFIGIFTKPIVLMIRLFANITAGHIIVLGFLFLIFILGNISPVAGYSVAPVSVIFALFISVLELLVAFVQAYIFATLSALYIGGAVKKAH